VATQGRSFWILDDLSVVQQYDAAHAGKNLQVYSPDAAYRMQAQGAVDGAVAAIPNTGENPPNGAAVPFWVKNVTDSTKATVTVYDKQAKKLKPTAPLQKTIK
jgi:hypothetical protein